MRRAAARYAGAGAPVPADPAVAPPANPPRPFSFAAYKGADVTAALEALFHKKCAYCESSYKAVLTVQVEHFRPKGRVDGVVDHPGYWWLAAKWENLLPSCVHCNGNEYHEVHRFGREPAYTVAAEGSAYKLGKYDHFPVRGQRAFGRADDLNVEDPLLIDPTRRDPAEHLQWLVEGGLSLVAPRQDGDDAWDPYGWTTYRTFGLNRQGLVEARTELMLQIVRQLKVGERFLERAVTMPASPYRDATIEDAFAALDELEAYALPDQPYSMMVRVLLDTHRQQLAVRFRDLLAAVPAPAAAPV